MTNKCIDCKYSNYTIKSNKQSLRCGWQLGTCGINSKCNLQESWNPYAKPYLKVDVDIDYNEKSMLSELTKSYFSIQINKDKTYPVFASFERLNDICMYNHIAPLDWKKIKHDFKNHKNRVNNG